MDRHLLSIINLSQHDALIRTDGLVEEEYLGWQERMPGPAFVEPLA